MPTRRQLLTGLGATSVTAMAWPNTAPAAPTGLDERKFLFIYLDGGWDTLKFTTPKFDASLIDMDESSELDEVNGIPYAASTLRPAVTEFLEAYGDRCCVINGMEVRSIAHERCRRILLTGEGIGGYDDWPSIIAGTSSQSDLILPYVVMNGWAYTSDYTHVVVRVGSNGQLPALLDGSAADDSVTTVSLPQNSAQELGDTWLREQVTALADQAPAGRRQEFYDSYGRLLGDLEQISGSSDLELSVQFDGCTRDVYATGAAIMDLMETGMTRCGMLSFRGLCDYGWDSHVNIDFQDNHYEYLFSYLNTLMEDLETRTSPSGAPLKDELVIVLCSEMGRHPIYNGGGGRDHWTYTSAVLIGSGINGGTVIGEMNDDFVGKGVDLASGEVSDTGAAVVPKHLGSTLLALADIDFNDHIPNGGGILQAALS